MMDLVFYIWAGKKPEKAGDWGWNFTYFNNGGDNKRNSSSHSPLLEAKQISSKLASSGQRR